MLIFSAEDLHPPNRWEARPHPIGSDIACLLKDTKLSRELRFSDVNAVANDAGIFPALCSRLGVNPARCGEVWGDSHGVLHEYGHDYLS